jgi:hypothetical protein
VEQIPSVWTRDSATILFERLKGGSYSLWSVDIRTGRQAPLFEAQSPTPLTPALTQDNKWLAYHTRDVLNGGVRDTVWIRPFPITPDRYEVSSEGTSHHPLWIAGGRELLFVIGAGQIVTREIRMSGTLEVGKSLTTAFTAPTQPPASLRPFDLLPDGHLVSDAEQASRSQGVAGVAALTSIDIVQNWFEELKARVPTK